MDRTAAVELAGTWRAAPADEALRRVYAEPGFDDSAWEPLEVPGHWRSTRAFAESDGPLLYRRPFGTPRATGGRRSWLVVDGLFYQGDVWLDGAYLGDTEGYFVPHTFEITDAVAARAEHVLAVEVTCAPQPDRTAKRNITGVFQHWDCLDPSWNPGGIWRPVRIEESGPVRIRSLRVLCREADETRAFVAVRAVLDSDAARRVRIRTTVGAVDHVEDQPLAEGQNQVEWRVRVDTPALWWPHALGDQPLHDVVVEVLVDGDGDGHGDDAGLERGGGASDRAHRRIGLRQLTWRRWTLTVNGERLFLKGSNQGPTRMQLAEATADELRGDVALAKEANLDLLRVHAHISRPELYEAADEAGMLLWQDFPLQWGYARGIRLQAVRQAAAAVDLLGHHPSIALWCAHNEPLAIDTEPTVLESPERIRKLARRAAVAMALPSWNKDVLDRSVKRALERHDGTRPVISGSGLWPGIGSTGTDSHLYFGWYWGDDRQLPGFLAAFPRMARFVSEFGAQAVPTSAAFMQPERWPDLDWERLRDHHALQKPLFDRVAPPAEAASFEAWTVETQRYQAELVRHHVEHLRRLKYRPTGGFAHFCLADGHPAVTWSVLDHERVPKLGYAALRDACAPVIVVADRPPAQVAPGEAVALDVHVVSDLRKPLAGATVTARLVAPPRGDDGDRGVWRWQGDIPADDCVRVGTIQLLAPAVAGTYRLSLELEAEGRRAANAYQLAVVAGS